MIEGTVLADTGVAVLRGALDPERAAAVARLLGEGALADRPGACVRPNNILTPLRWCDDLTALVLDDRGLIGRVAAATGATDLRWISGYVSTREPDTGPLPLHHDWWCWDHPASAAVTAPQVAVIVYLSATTPACAALRVVPGSHRRRPDGLAVDDAGTVVGGDPETETIPAAPGDAVVIDYRLLHGTTANETAGCRDAVIVNFAPAWSDLAPDLRGHLISHPALPGATEVVPAHGWPARLLPSFSGPRRDLPLSRRPT